MRNDAGMGFGVYWIIYEKIRLVKQFECNLDGEF